MTRASSFLAAAQQEPDVVTWTAGYDDRLFNAYVLVEAMAGASRPLQIDTLAHGCPAQRDIRHALDKSAGPARNFPMEASVAPDLDFPDGRSDAGARDGERGEGD